MIEIDPKDPHHMGRQLAARVAADLRYWSEQVSRLPAKLDGVPEPTRSELASALQAASDAAQDALKQFRLYSESGRS